MTCTVTVCLCLSVYISAYQFCYFWPLIDSVLSLSMSPLSKNSLQDTNNNFNKYTGLTSNAVKKRCYGVEKLRTRIIISDGL